MLKINTVTSVCDLFYSTNEYAHIKCRPIWSYGFESNLCYNLCYNQHCNIWKRLHSIGVLEGKEEETILSTMNHKWYTLLMLTSWKQIPVNGNFGQFANWLILLKWSFWFKKKHSMITRFSQTLSYPKKYRIIDNV